MNVELCSKLMKKPKRETFDSLGALKCLNANLSEFSCYHFYLPSALGRPSTVFPVQILQKIIENFSDSNVFPIYVLVIFNLDR